VTDLHARAAEAAGRIAGAEALLITAGAGMGVDSGLPDFRGDEGFWRAYPPYRHLGLGFMDLANPRWFRVDPTLAWGFYGHRLALYRSTAPHAGFAILRRWWARMPRGGFVFTSNVDGQFGRAGVPEDAVCECHGTIGVLQCTRRCGRAPWPAGDVAPHVDPRTMRVDAGDLPACPGCGAVARPAILMWDDAGWDPSRTVAQEARLQAWLSGVGDPSRLAVVECGAGTAVPTVRLLGERLAAAGAALIRVNPHEAWTPPGGVALRAGALRALQAVDRALAARPGWAAPAAGAS
jgi:NAD-dependent SIR2 family protein deacetylase